jgi:hypothetical protein
MTNPSLPGSLASPLPTSSSGELQPDAEDEIFEIIKRDGRDAKVRAKQNSTGESSS